MKINLEDKLNKEARSEKNHRIFWMCSLILPSIAILFIQHQVGENFANYCNELIKPFYEAAQAVKPATDVIGKVWDTVIATTKEVTKAVAPDSVKEEYHRMVKIYDGIQLIFKIVKWFSFFGFFLYVIRVIRDVIYIKKMHEKYLEETKNGTRNTFMFLYYTSIFINNFFAVALLYFAHLYLPFFSF